MKSSWRWLGIAVPSGELSFTLGVFVLLAFLFPLLTPDARADCTPAPSGLIAWWPGDGFALDVAGTNHGTLQNGASYTNGMIGPAFNFDGVDDRVAIAESPATDISRMLRWTIEAWVRPTSFTSQNYPTIYSEGRWGVSLEINNPTGKLESYINKRQPARGHGCPAIECVEPHCTYLGWNEPRLLRQRGVCRLRFCTSDLAR